MKSRTAGSALMPRAARTIRAAPTTTIGTIHTSLNQRLRGVFARAAEGGVAVLIASDPTHSRHPFETPIRDIRDSVEERRDGVADPRPLVQPTSVPALDLQDGDIRDR